MVNEKFKNLMSPGKIGNLEIPNRLVSVPIGSALSTSDGLVSPRLLSHFQDLAMGGTGLIIVESAYPDEIFSKGEEGELGAYGAVCGPGLALLATAIHDWGVKASVQLSHMGVQFFMAEKFKSWSPSDGVYEMEGLQFPLTGMTNGEIKDLIAAFGKAALRLKLAGFDSVDLNAAHGHLISNFFSTIFNKRTDEYGGSLENRCRIVVEMVQDIQSYCGKDFPITIRMGQDYEPVNPVGREDIIFIAKKLEEVGVAAINLSAGLTSNWYTLPPTYEKRGLNVPDARALKNAGLKIPIIVAGGITTPDFAEEILAEGSADFIGLGRPLLADPYWIKKIEAGAPEDIVPCIRCGMDCVGTMDVFIAAKGIRCGLNPRCALQDIRKVAPLVKKKKVAVIGGGPGGMEAARLAKARGHDVTLYEKRKLGGALHEAGWDTDLKPDIQFLLNYYLAQMKKLEIKVIPEEATFDSIKNGGYDVAIVATGAVRNELAVPGINKPHVYTDLEVTGGKDKELGKTVIVVGGGEVAVEIAISQAMKGKKVIMTTRRSGDFDIASEVSAPNRMYLMAKLKTYNIQIHLGLTLKEITDDGIISVDENGETKEIKGDSVVICAGYLPNNTLASALKGKVKELRIIGDCSKPRLIGDAIQEAWLAANQI